MKRKLTPSELKAYRELAQAARKVRRAQERARAIRQKAKGGAQ
jgi:hypothetical protein